jgi:hypothetical protein
MQVKMSFRRKEGNAGRAYEYMGREKRGEIFEHVCAILYAATHVSLFGRYGVQINWLVLTSFFANWYSFYIEMHCLLFV